MMARRDRLPIGSAALVRHRGDGGGRGVQVEVGAPHGPRTQVGVELVLERDTPVGMLTAAKSWSLMPSSNLTTARSELPWAATSTSEPPARSSAIGPSQGDRAVGRILLPPVILRITVSRSAWALATAALAGNPRWSGERSGRGQQASTSVRARR